MTDQHPAEKALDEVLDIMADRIDDPEEYRAAEEATARMRDRWIEADGRSDVSIPNVYVEDGTL